MSDFFWYNDYTDLLRNSLDGFWDRILPLVRKFEEKYNLPKSSLLFKNWEKRSEWFYRLVKEVLIRDDTLFTKLSEKDQKKQLQTINTVYQTAKKFHEHQERSSWERYFEHLFSTSLIVLLELPNPNLKKVLTALYHDSIEDNPKDVNKTVIKANIWGKLWEQVADSVEQISKKDLRTYMTDDQIKSFEIDIWSLEDEESLEEYLKWNWYQDLLTEIKLKRTQDYFWHMKDLDQDTLDVKFADRIHNLRTMKTQSANQINKKVSETLKYFIPLAKQRNTVAYNLMMVEIIKLKVFLTSDNLFNLFEYAPEMKNVS